MKARDQELLMFLGAAGVLGYAMLATRSRGAPSSQRPARLRDWRGYVWPIATRSDGRKAVITDGWHYRETSKKWHQGVDVMFRRRPGESDQLPRGTKNFYVPQPTLARSVADGTVKIAKTISTGGYVRVDHGDGVITQYMHLRGLRVKPGQRVEMGQPIGIVSHNTSKGGYPLDHLHFEVLLDGAKVDPAPHMKQWKRVAEAKPEGSSPDGGSDDT